MKKTTVFLFILLCINAFCAASELVLSPFNGGTGVPMNSTNYPSRKGVTALSFVNGGTLSDVTDNIKFVNDNIIGMGVYKNGNLDGLTDLTLMIDIVCPTSFMFVSQSNTLFRRPFEIAINLNYQYSKTGDGLGKAEFSKVVSLTAGDNNITLDLGEYLETALIDETGGLLYVWFDIILALPFDSGSSTDSGVVVNTVTYPLVESDDYSAVVDLNVTVQEEYNNQAKTPAVYSMTLPFTGYYSRYSSDKRTASVSMNVSMYPSASNLNLNPVSKTGPRTYIDIGEFDFMYLDIKATSAIGSKKIFFSANPSPYTPSDGFFMVHNNATRVEEGYNAVRYSLRVRDEEGKSGPVIFDGGNYIDNNGNIYNKAGNLCAGDEYISSKQSSATIQHSNSTFYFSTYSGVISILVDDTNETMVPGIYRSDIYIHVVAD